MPDVGRSDSQRSHCSQRPRVSFNRDVHVKRIGPSVGVGGGGGGSAGGGGGVGGTGSGGGRLVGALAGDGAGHLVPLAVRRERPSRLSRRQLAEEARRVLQQAERVACTSSADGSRRFATLPPLRLGRKGARRTLSLREKTGSRAESPSPASGPVAPPRLGGGKRARVSLTRSASDAGRKDTPSGDNAKFASLQRPKKQRSYSDQDRSPSPTAKPRRHILKKSHSDSESTPTAPLAADVRVKKQLSPIIEVSPREDYFTEAEMLRGGASGHRGRSAVETMVRRLSADAVGPPRRPPRGVSPSALVAPGEDRRHNNNLPFSYTDGRAPSPTRPVASAAASPLPKSPPQQVIYAEVVVSGNGHGKQTVHTAVPLHSDEDEGLGMADRGRADGMDARRRDPLLEESSRFDGNDLSSRRDRLESRIESQRKERFTSGRLATDTSYSSRRDFLHSQLDYDGDSRRYNDSDKKDIFADSGIEVDYRKDSASNGFQRFDDSPNDSLTAKIVIGGGGGGGVSSRREESRVTRVDLNGGGRSRDEDTDGGGSYFRSKTHREHRSGGGGGGSTTFSSTRLVQEQRRSSDVLPTSSVLIRHYAPGRGGSPSASDRFLHAERSHVRAVDHDPAPASEDEYETRAPRREIPPARSPSGRASPEHSASSLKDKKKDTAKKKNVSAMDRVKQLFTRSNGDSKTLKKTKKKEQKAKESLDEEEEEDPVRARYTEYRGGGGGRTESDQETVTASRGGSPSRQGSPTRQASPSRHRERTPSPYMQGRYRDHSPMHAPPSPRRGPSPLPSDPHLLQVPGRQHHHTRGGDRSPHDGTRKSPRREQREVEFNYSRQRLATPDVTPTPSPAPARAAQSSATLNRINNQKNKDQHGGNWFKSLDRLTKRNKNRIKEDDVISNKDKSNGNSKTLRYFGDTDQEDKDSVASIPPPMPLQNHYRYKSNNHLGHSNSNSINRIHISSRNTTNRSHRPHHRSAGDVATSSAESTTEGDSSQQSQRSIVYLHAATVGDIPTPVKRNVTRRAQSREELSSVTSSHLQPQKRTISRSISVLAPWRPRHYRDGQELHYDQEDNNKNYIKNGKPPKIPLSQQSSLNSATMNRINRKKNAENKMNGSYKHYVGKATSTESLSQHSTRQYGDRGTLKKHIPVHQAASVESLSHHSNQSSSRLQNKSKTNDKKNGMNTSMSELTASNKQNTQQKNKTNDVGKKNSSKVSRSASMPKDSRVKAGWFKLRNKKQGT